LLAVAVWWVQSRTVFGMQSRATGLNARAAAFAGVPLGRTLMLVGCLSGGLAGLAGAIEVMGVKGYVTTDLSPNYGYSGIVIAMLANLNPIGVIGAALFSAVMFVGADSMSRALGVPSYIADVTVALSLLTMLVAHLPHAIPGAAMSEGPGHPGLRGPVGGGPAHRHAAHSRHAGACFCASGWAC
jgi:ABC-type uncharacterized transport system permease subunit